MIEKIKIINYGPFKNQEINLAQYSSPIYVIGMNDVGKTCFLTAINSLKDGLNRKYRHVDVTKNHKRELTSKILITYDFDESNYSDKEKKDLIDNFGNFFIGKLEITRNFLSPNSKSFNTLLNENKNLKSWVTKALETINSNLGSEEKLNFKKYNDIEFDDFFEELFIKEISKNYKNELYNKTHNHRNKLLHDAQDYSTNFDSYKIIKNYFSDNEYYNTNSFIKNPKKQRVFFQIQLFNKFKEIIKNIFEKVLYLPANSANHFNFIRSNYRMLKLQTQDDDFLESHWHDLKKLLITFLKREDTERFKKIIFSDLDEDDKTNKIIEYSDQITEQMQNFFSKYFPAQNKDLKFQLKYNNNEIKFVVKDEITGYESLLTRSDGFKWFLQLYITLKSLKKGSILVIDEPEKFLHASAQTHLVNLFEELTKEKKLQIIFATHSPYMLCNVPFKNIKIIEKNYIEVINEKDDKKSKIKESIIYNSVDKYINLSTSDKKTDSLTPIATALGIPYFNLLLSFNIFRKKVIFVEGVADIWTIRLAAKLNGIEIKEWFIWPLMGETKLCPITMGISLNLDYIVLFDNPTHKKKFKDLDDITKSYSLSEIVENMNNPEDMLDKETTLKDYRLNEKSNHKFGWVSLHDDVIIYGKKNLSNNEKKNLKKYIEGINRILNKKIFFN